jgi:glycosyltransferase involved in cell wall biosynthesis
LHAADASLISVVMSVYNGAPYLVEAIRSILVQTHGNLEFVITDDGSSDGSAAIIRDHAAKDERIRPIFLDHSGLALADNTGVGLARGEWIARMDQDDIALPRRLEVQLAYMRATGVDICGSLAETFGTEQRVYWYPETHEAIRREFVFRFGILQPTALVKSRILKEHPYSERTRCVDYEFWTRLISRYRMANVPQVLLKYRRHERQTSVTDGGRFKADLRRHRFRYFYTLFPDTPLRDYLPLSRIADNLPMPSLAELERAGQWLWELSRAPASELGGIMIERWKKTWDRSSNLGPDGYAVYRRYLEELENLSVCRTLSAHE